MDDYWWEWMWMCVCLFFRTASYSLFTLLFHIPFVVVVFAKCWHNQTFLMTHSNPNSDSHSHIVCGGNFYFSHDTRIYKRTYSKFMKRDFVVIHSCVFSHFAYSLSNVNTRNWTIRLTPSTEMKLYLPCVNYFRIRVRTNFLFHLFRSPFFFILR